MPVTPAHFGDIISCEIELGPAGEALVTDHAIRQKVGSAELPYAVRGLRYMPKSPGIIYFLPSNCWRPNYGGFTFQASMPDGKTGRAVALFKDGRDARRVWDYARNRKQGSIILQGIASPTGEIRWFCYMRFRHYETQRKRRPGQKKDRSSSIASMPRVGHGDADDARGSPL